MSLFQRMICFLFSLSIALPAGPAVYGAQKSKTPEIKPAPKAPALKIGKQPSKEQESARRTQSINNMKMIALALLNYTSAKREFPLQAVLDTQRKPLLSWRVQVLPYMEDEKAQNLYREFRLDEPWDSEHNKKLIDKMPAVYRNPYLPLGNTTNYLVPVAQGSIFGGERPTRNRDIKDGHSKTIMVVEADADRAVPWTKPADCEVDPEKPLSGLGNLRPGGMFNAAFADGRVTSLSRDLNAEAFLLLLNKADGKPVALPD
jgi:prepilin-type processing-associated H-X9-DG protein